MSAFHTLQNTFNSLGMRHGELTVDRETFSALWHDAPDDMRRPGVSQTQAWLRRPMRTFVRSGAISPEYAAATRVSVDARVRIPLALGEHLIVRMEEP